MTVEACLLVSQLCCSILAYDPPGTRWDLSDSRKEFACSISKDIEFFANKWDLEPELLTSVIIVESRFNPNAVSSANACGLTQVIPKWTGGKASRGKKYTCKQLKNPKTSLEAGSAILSWWISYAKDKTEGLCSYNAGWKGCKVSSGYARIVKRLVNYLKQDEDS